MQRNSKFLFIYFYFYYDFVVNFKGGSCLLVDISKISRSESFVPFTKMLKFNNFYKEKKFCRPQNVVLSRNRGSFIDNNAYVIYLKCSLIFDTRTGRSVSFGHL